MQETDHHSKNQRGSSPPFQEIEKWIDDGANGSHWVKVAGSVLRKEDHRLIERPAVESAAMFKSDDEGRWADDGGKSIPVPLDDAGGMLQ